MNAFDTLRLLDYAFLPLLRCAWQSVSMEVVAELKRNKEFDNVDSRRSIIEALPIRRSYGPFVIELFSP